MTMGTKRPKSTGYAVCVENRGYEASLEVRKLYPMLADAEGEAEGMVRVVDESGEDYLYPAQMFERVALSVEAVRVLRRAS